jgi:hypothetical protein
MPPKHRHRPTASLHALAARVGDTWADPYNLQILCGVSRVAETWATSLPLETRAPPVGADDDEDRYALHLLGRVRGIDLWLAQR